MVQITTFTITAFLIVAPAIQAASFSRDEFEDLALREISDGLVFRRHHIHLPKIHLPHIDGKKILDGLKKYGPKIGKAVFKLAKMILREDAEEQYLASRDTDGAQDLYELLARSPKGTWKKLLKTVKKMKKYVKTGMKLAQSLQGAAGGAEDFVSREVGGNWEYELVERFFDDSGISARDLYFQLAVLERGLLEVVYDEREDHRVSSRYYVLEMNFRRDYNDFGLEDLD